MMERDDLTRLLRDYYARAADWNDYQGRQRIKLIKAYNAEPYGNEREGRSNVVLSDVRDTVLAMLPSLMRIFFSHQRAVEFVPTAPEHAEVAEQATDYVNYVIRQDNPGFLEFYRWFKDALIYGLGVMKLWWDERKIVRATEVSGLDEEAARLLQAEAALSGGAMTVALEPGPDGFHGTVNYIGSQDTLRLRVVPPEEFLIEPGAVDIESARYVAHRTYLSVSDLVALGYPLDFVLEHSRRGSTMDVFSPERVERWRGGVIYDAGTEADETSRPVLYIEHYVYVDADGDGIAELRKLCTIGESMELVSDDVVEERPFAVLSPDPEAHQFFGTSVAERLYDIQRVKTAVMRGILDSLAQSIIPRMGVVEGRVSLADVLNQDVGAPIRMDAPGMVQPFVTPFVGKEAFPLLSYFDEIKENRTGVTKAAVGLDPDSLQSATQAAVAATIRGSQEHVELIARVFAEMGVAPLYRLAYRLLVRNQRKARVVKMRGRWVSVNPSTWASDLQVIVNVGVGEATTQDRLQALLGLAQKMEQLMANLGPNPLVRLSHYRDVLVRALELSGIQDAARYLPQIDPAAEQAMIDRALAQASNPEKEAAAMLAQVQVEQMRADIAMKEAELRLREKDIELRHERELKKMLLEADVKLAELRMKHGADAAAAFNAADKLTDEVVMSDAAGIDERGNTPGFGAEGTPGTGLPE